jgi:hypothetical protein
MKRIAYAAGRPIDMSPAAKSLAITLRPVRDYARRVVGAA